MAFYCTSALGFWPYRRTLDEMPPEFGEEFLALCRSCVPYQARLLEQIAERLTLG